MNYKKWFKYIIGIKFFKFTSARVISLGFILIILFGAILLDLPISSNRGKTVNFIDALFTSVSSVCVTGLVVVDTNIQWSCFGKIIILTLIQIGALGIMSVVTVFSVITGKQLSLRERLTIQESTNNFTLSGIVKTFKGILVITVFIELIGAIIVSTELIPIYGFKTGIIKSIFHSVSAFCNAGFDIFGTEANRFTSLTHFSEKPLFLLTTSALVILGGLGFVVWSDIWSKRKFSKFTLHSKLVIFTTIALLIGGTLLFFLFEYDNPGTMKNMPFHTKLLNSYFQSVTTRTAGFNSINIHDMNEVTNFITILFMFIGGAPGSTAGGIKVTTFCVIVMTAVSFSKGQEEVQVFGRRIPSNIISKSVVIIFSSTLIIIFSTILLLINREGRFLEVLYESVSAFGTTGLSTGITSGLSEFSKVVLILTMILGRIGPFTAIVAFTSLQKNKNITYRYPEGKITVG